MNGCLECDRLRQELDRVKALAEQDAHNFAAAEQGRLREIRKLKKKLEGDAPKTSPRDAEALELQEYWLANCVPRNGQKRTVIGIGSDRHKLALSKLGTYPLADLKTCVDRIAREPYVSATGRQASPDGARRFADLDHCIGNDFRIKKNLEAMEALKEEQAQEYTGVAGVLGYPVPKLLGSLAEHGCYFQRFGQGKSEHWISGCPSCRVDKTLVITESAEHDADVLCNEGCATTDVLDALGMRLSDLWVDREADEG